MCGSLGRAHVGFMAFLWMEKQAVRLMKLEHCLAVAARSLSAGAGSGYAAGRADVAQPVR